MSRSLLEPKYIGGLLVPPGRAYTLLTDHLICGKPLGSEHIQEKWFQYKPSIHIRLIGLEGCLYLKRYKLAMIRKTRNQKEIPTQIDNLVLVVREHIVSRVSSYFPTGGHLVTRK